MELCKINEDYLEEIKDPVPFHPCSTPRGMSWYDLSILTAFQQKQLNEMKVDVIREDNRYLTKHPEIRALVSLFVQEIFRKQPVTISIAECAKRYFCRSQGDIEKDVHEYLAKRGEPLKKDGDSAVNLGIEFSPRSSVPMHADDLSIFHPDYYYYLSFTDEGSEPEEEGEGDFPFKRYAYGSPRSFSTSMTSATTSYTAETVNVIKIDDFNKKYSHPVSNLASTVDVDDKVETILEPTMLVVTPAATIIDSESEDPMSEIEEKTRSMLEVKLAAALAEEQAEAQLPEVHVEEQPEVQVEEPPEVNTEEDGDE